MISFFAWSVIFSDNANEYAKYEWMKKRQRWEYTVKLLEILFNSLKSPKIFDLEIGKFNWEIF